MIQALAAIQKATLAARKRTGDRSIGTRVKSGRLQVVRVTYDGKGKATVTPCSEWMAADQLVAVIDAL